MKMISKKIQKDTIQMRKIILETSFKWVQLLYWGALSIVDILACLYQNILKIKEKTEIFLY